MKSYRGLLSSHSHGDSTDVLFLSSIADPLAEELKWMHGKNVTVRYWLSDVDAEKDSVDEEFLKVMSGYADVEFWARYSEITGYLWTDEELTIGGHDLMWELSSNEGKWLILEIETID